jgi:hypothetical protein
VILGRAIVHPERIKCAAVLTAVKVDLEAFVSAAGMVCRPTLTSAARAGCGDPRSGRRKGLRRGRTKEADGRDSVP